jgi:hypothetical protein
VPAYQRHAQLLDMRRQHASLNNALAASGRFLLADVRNFLNGQITLSSLPRGSARDDTNLSTLLERIHTLESREISHARIISLYAARGALININKALGNRDWQDEPLSVREIANLKAAIVEVEERAAIARYDADFALGRVRSAQISWPARPVAGIILTCMAFFKHSDVPAVDRIFGTK